MAGQSYRGQFLYTLVVKVPSVLEVPQELQILAATTSKAKREARRMVAGMLGVDAGAVVCISVSKKRLAGGLTPR